MQLRNFVRAVVVHLSHEESVAFAAGIQPVRDDLADHWHVLANSDEVGDGEHDGGPAQAEPVDVSVLAGVEADLVAEKAKVAALEANASEFDKTLADRVAERDAAFAEIEPLKAEVARLTEALAKAEADLEAATAPKDETKPAGAKKAAGK